MVPREGSKGAKSRRASPAARQSGCWIGGGQPEQQLRRGHGGHVAGFGGDLVCSWDLAAGGQILRDSSPVQLPPAAGQLNLHQCQHLQRDKQRRIESNAVPQSLLPDDGFTFPRRPGTRCEGDYHTVAATWGPTHRTRTRRHRLAAVQPRPDRPAYGQRGRGRESDREREREREREFV